MYIQIFLPNSLKMEVKYIFIHDYLKDVWELIIILNKTVLKFLQKGVQKTRKMYNLKLKISKASGA